MKARREGERTQLVEERAVLGDEVNSLEVTLPHLPETVARHDEERMKERIAAEQRAFQAEKLARAEAACALS